MSPPLHDASIWPRNGHGKKACGGWAKRLVGLGEAGQQGMARQLGEPVTSCFGGAVSRLDVACVFASAMSSPMLHLFFFKDG
jgi:hypothetical protein